MVKDSMLHEDFLKELCEFKHQFIWTKIISLNLEEEPIEEITGRITNGSINIDGSSAVRRTCSLTLVAQDVNINDCYWSLKTKFKVYIGLENHIDDTYPDIIWFKQGTFLITSFNCSVGVNNYTISIQGKDKMSLLNGEFGGVIPSTWDFGSMDETLEDGTIQNTLIPIKDIVLQAVHEYAQEPWQNIIVNDLDDYGIELLRYIGEKPFYYVIGLDAHGDNNSREVAQMIFNKDQLVSVQLVDWVNGKAVEVGWTDFDVKISKLENFQKTKQWPADRASSPPVYCYEKLLEQLDPSGNVTETKNYWRARVKFEGDDTIYTIAKIENTNGLEVCGYRICDIVYPYDLIEEVGSTITTMLDKLVKMLGNFEYFYDTDGRFIFQKKRTFLDVSYNNIIGEHSINQEVWVEDSMFNSKYSYVFDENTLISSIQNNPNLSEIKNDYSLWGSRKEGESEMPIHARYAIDHKPMWYKAFPKDGEEEGMIYCTQKGLDRYLQEKLDFEKLSGREIENQADKRQKKYFKTKNTNGLPESWWDVLDWAKYYAIIAVMKEQKDPEELSEEALAAYYPNKVLGNYRESSEASFYPSKEEIQEKLGDAYKLTKVQHTNAQVIWVNEDGKTWGTHILNCGHTYNDFLPGGRFWSETFQNNIPSNVKAYVYKPTFPGEISYRYDEDEYEEIEIDLSEYLPDKYKLVDWREIIYQMANDYRRRYRDDDFLLDLKNNNMWTPYYYLYPKGYTGYEKYYVDFEMNLSQGVLAYWRELYNPEAISNGYENTTGRYLPSGEFVRDSSYPFWVKGTVYKKGDYVWYSKLNEKTGEMEKHVYVSSSNNNTTEPETKNTKWSISDGDFTYNSDGWNVDVLNSPETLNFWFDFLDTDGKLNAYGVNNIGQRTKAANDTDIKSIYFRETPNVIFDFGDDDIQEKWLKPGYSHIKIPKGYSGIFTISNRGKNAMDVIEDYLYQYAFPAAAISFNSVPVYYLTPNTLIYLNDKKTGVVGEYILQKYSIQLGTTSQMSVNAIETTKRLY